MPVSRRLLLSLPLAVVCLRRADAADSTAAIATINRFYGVLLAVMKAAKGLSFDQRYARLSPAIEEAFNLALMTRIAVGPVWPQLAPAQQQRLTQAFGRFTISEYAGRFDGYSGERFEVDPAAVANPNGVIVETALVKSGGEKVALNYLMRQGAGGAWQIIDVYLKGTISQLATRRSEFTGVLQRSGADGLVRVLDQRSAALRIG